MSYRDYYTINTHPEGFMCVAVDKDLNFVKQYKISIYNGKLSNCECVAGHTWCRHKQMVVLFQQLGRVDKRWYHNFDRKRDNWIEPPKQEM